MTERKIVRSFLVTQGLKSGYAIRAVGILIKDDETRETFSDLWSVASDPEELGEVMTEITADLEALTAEFEAELAAKEAGSVNAEDVYDGEPDQPDDPNVGNEP